VAITDALILSPDVLLVPVADLPEGTRSRFTHGEGDIAITHPRSRVPSRILDAAAAGLLEEFREPRTVIEAVIRFSRTHGADPEQTLEDAYPLLRRLLDSGFLVAHGAPESAGIRPWLRPGAEIAGFEILECLHVLEDTELYSARGTKGLAALKIERPSPEGRPSATLEREREILALLDGDGVPRLLADGEAEGRRWLALEWCAGVDAESAAREARRAGGAAVLALCRAVAAAYAGLHRRGVLHGDVHSRNLLVSRDGSVRLLDFGYSRLDGAAAGPVRAGVPFYYEPELAAAFRQDGALPPASPAGEQYAVGALLHLIATGAHYLDFSLEREGMLRQICEEPPLPFADRGIEPWPELEAVLARALRKEPGERFASLAALAAALAALEPPGAAGGPFRDGPSAACDLLDRVLDRVSEEGGLLAAGLPSAPVASVNFGAAGIACGLYRIAMAREDPRLLALSDLWAEKAAASCGLETAFYNAETGVTRATVGECSTYHTAPGVHAVRALVAHASGLTGVQATAVAAFLAAVREPGANMDLVLGRAGLLLAAALLLDTLADSAPTAAVRTRLTAWGDDQLQSLWAGLDPLSPRYLEGEANLGMAHGWAGFLYSSLRWCRAAGRPLPVRLPDRLAELADLALPWGRGARWRWYGDGRRAGFMSGWCNGSAGFVFLWTLAHRTLNDPRYAALAEEAAWNAWEDPGREASLCCGLAGRAYALLHLHRHGGGPEWLERARDLAGRAAAAAEQSAEAPHSLYKGELGVAVLAADLARPEAAAFPFFEEEGWAPGGPSGK
jgi:serine/threonine protein kinase